jgi:hypothetical protein
MPETRSGLLLGNGSVSTFPRQQIDAVTDEMFEVLISLRFAPSYKRFIREGVQSYYTLILAPHTRVEAGSNTSTVTLRVVGGHEKGSLESETVKYGHESYGTRTRK